MYTNGLKDRFGSPLISKRDADKTYVKTEDFGHIIGSEYETTKNATDNGECNAISIASANLPHNCEIKEIRIPVLQTIETPVYVAVWTVTSGGTKTYCGLSDNKVTCLGGEDAIWLFEKNSFSIPEGNTLEIFLAENESSVQENNTNTTNIHISTYVNYSGSGSVRYFDSWYSGRDVLVILKTTSSFLTQSDIEYSIDKITGRLTSTEVNLEEMNYNIDGINDAIGVLSKDLFNLKNSLNDLPTSGDGSTTIINQGTSLNENDRAIIDSITKKYTTYKTGVFDKSLTIEWGNANISSFSLGDNHLPKGTIKTVSVYGRDTTTSNDASTNGCYLIAQVFDSESNLKKTHVSTNKRVVAYRASSSENILNTWTFEGIVRQKGDKITFTPSPDGKTINSGYQFGALVDSTHTHNDCGCGSNKWLILGEFGGDFYEDNHVLSHVSDDGVHLTTKEKEVVRALYTKGEASIVFDNNINNESVGNASIKGFILARPYITNCIFDEIRWTHEGTTSGNLYLSLTLKDVNGKVVKKVMSTNTQNFGGTEEKIYKFNEEIQITDSIGSIVFEPSADGSTISTSHQFRVSVIGNAAKGDTNGSESTNNNFTINVKFYNSSAISKVDYLNETIGYEFATVTTTHADCECNAIHLVSGLPYGCKIDRISIPVKNTVTTPLYLAVWTLDANGTKTYRGLSEKAISWTAGKRATWTFAESFVIPQGHKLEIFLAENSAAVGETETNTINYHLVCDYKTGGSGTVRWQNGWYGGRDVLVYVGKSGISNNAGIGGLTKDEADALYATKGEVKQYDWTPDWIHAIYNDGTTDYTAPINGWVSTCSSSQPYGQIRINGQVAGYNASSGSFTMLLKGGDEIHFDNGGQFLFAPCNSEQCDWRETKTNYDIWKNAICYDENGNPYLQDLYIPDASRWCGEIRVPNNLNVTKIEDEKAYNGNDFVCNIQTSEIVVSTGLFTTSPIVAVEGDFGKLEKSSYMFDCSESLQSFDVQELPNLRCGERMFYHCTALTSFTTDMPKLVYGADMFLNTPSLTNFDANLSSLKCGSRMFGCEYSSVNSPLSVQSVANIASKINDISNLNRTYDADWRYTVFGQRYTIPASERGVIWLGCAEGLENNSSVLNSIKTLNQKGWNVILNGNEFNIEGGNPAYDVSITNGYIPDATGWGSVVRQSNNLVITRVEDGVAYND